MSLLSGLGKGLMLAGDAVGKGVSQYAQIKSEEEREALRQASIERRWAVEDKRYQEAKATEKTRYQDTKSRDDARYKTEKDWREAQAKKLEVSETRQNEKQDAMLIGQAIDRLSTDYKETLEEIDKAYLDPMTGQPSDPVKYAKKQAEAKAMYDSGRTNIVQRSGLTKQQIDKFGFGMYLPEEAAPTTPEPSTPIPEAKPGFDRKAWADSVRSSHGQSTVPAAVDSATMPTAITPDEMAKLTPEQQRERIAQLQALRQNGAAQTKQTPTTGLLNRIQGVW